MHQIQDNIKISKIFSFFNTKISKLTKKLFKALSPHWKYNLSKKVFECVKWAVLVVKMDIIGFLRCGLVLGEKNFENLFLGKIF